MCTDATQTVHSEGFKGFTMEGEWEEDSNCQDITRHQSLLTASMGFYSLSESPSMANAGWSQSELLILGKLLTRPITQMDSCFQQACLSVPHQHSPVKNTPGDTYLIRRPLFNRTCYDTKCCYLIKHWWFNVWNKKVVGCCHTAQHPAHYRSHLSRS